MILVRPPFPFWTMSKIKGIFTGWLFLVIHLLNVLLQCCRAAWATQGLLKQVCKQKLCCSSTESLAVFVHCANRTVGAERMAVKFWSLKVASLGALLQDGPTTAAAVRPLAGPLAE